MNALPIVLASLLFFAIAYRFYSAFLVAKVMVLDDARKTPAYTLQDGQNYCPTNKWVLFGHHFAAIAGAGPLIGPVLAAQFGYAPGLLWILFGSVLAGGVHDLFILVASIRHQGKSLVEIARAEIDPFTAIVTSIAVLIIIIIALAGLGLAVVNALKDSSWGTFTIAMTIPIALLVGFWMEKWRVGRIREASIIGVILVLAAVFFGGTIPGSILAPYFTLSKDQLVIALATYGIFASVLPVWMLLCPRDYLSSYLKIGTVVLLFIGVCFVQPRLQMPAFTEFIHGGGPIIPGQLFPFLFITIACGAISGFHSLIGSGTTPKMIMKESEARMIGYGAMLVEGAVSVVALIAACSLHPADYFAINVSPEKFKALGMIPVHLDALSLAVGENIAGRPGGAVSLAVGFAQIFSALPFPKMNTLMSYFYHFTIMFEALFILTTIDAGTRVARFMVQEFAGKFYPPIARTDSWSASIIVSIFVVAAWSYFIWAGNISTIWPMFGTANQLLAAVALAVASVYIVNNGKIRYLWVTALPLAFISITTLYACFCNIKDNFIPLTSVEGKEFFAWINISLTCVIIFCAVTVIFMSSKKILKVSKVK